MSVEYQIARDPTINWIIGPVGRCIDFIATETAMAGLLTRGLQALPMLEPLMRVAAKEIQKIRGPTALHPFRQFLAEYAGMGDMAKRLEADDYALVNGHALIAIWSALETCIEDTVVLILMHDTDSVRVVQDVVRLRTGNDGLLDEEQARRVFRSLERRERQQNGVMESYDAILELFDLERSPKGDYSVAMSEVNALRNSLMHRAGVVDERTVSQAPTLRRALGQKIKVGGEEYLKYYQAVAGYAQELLQGVLKSKFIRSSEELGKSEA